MKLEVIVLTNMIAQLLNIMVPIWINRVTMKTYMQTHSTAIALQRMNTLKVYVWNACHVMSCLAFILALWQFPEYATPRSFIGYSLIILYAVVIVVYGQLTFHRVIRRIRHTHTRVTDELWSTLKDLTIILLPIIAYKCFRLYGGLSFEDTELKKFGFYAFFMLVLQMVYPYMTYLHLGAKPIQNQDIQQSLRLFLKKCEATNIQVYEFPSKKRKAAHAWVSGIWFKKIFISDYVLEQLTPNELHTVVAHEIGHCKKYHQPIMIALLMVSFPLVFAIVEIWEWIETSLMLQPSIFLGFCFLGVSLGAYYIFVYQAVSKLHEHQADQYVLQLCAKQDFISALSKLTQLNHELKRFTKLTEKLRSHPSLENRIKWMEHVQRLPE